MADPKRHDVESRLALPLNLGTVALLWAVIVAAWPVQFWTMADDYELLALAHALNLESGLRDGIRYGDEGLWNHPGIPFYLVSWLCLRFAALFSGAGDIVAQALAQPQAFFLATRAAAGAITASAIAATWQILRPLPAGRRVIALAAFFAASHQSFNYGLTLLGNETFALPVTALFFWAVKRIGDTAPGRLRYWFILGAVAALGYSVKVLYLHLLAAAIAMAMADAWIQRGQGHAHFLLRAIPSLGLVALGFLTAVIPLLLVVIGWEGTRHLLRFHWLVFTHAALYGTGEASVVSGAAVWQALVYLRDHPMTPLLVVPVVTLLAVSFLHRMRRGTGEHASLLWDTAVLAALVSLTLAVLKHFNAHYLVALCALIPFALAGLLSRSSVTQCRTSAVVVTCCLAASMSLAVIEYAKRSVIAARIADDEAAIKAMPLKAGEARLWTYAVPMQHFGEGFVGRSAGVGSLKSMLKNPQRQELSSLSEVMPAQGYRYIVLDKRYFPDLDTVRHKQGSLDPTDALNIKPRADDRLYEFNTVIVVERQMQ